MVIVPQYNDEDAIIANNDYRWYIHIYNIFISSIIY